MPAMGLNAKCYLVLVAVWQAANFSAICSETCLCTDDLLMCQKCSYNLTLKENSSTFEVSMCCNESDKLSVLPQNHVNKTFLEVRVHFGKSCNVSDVALDFSLFNTNSVTLQNTNLSKIKITAKNLSELDLSDNKLKSLTRGLFSESIGLKKLVLSGNLISSIDEDSFVGIDKLEALDLSGNKLTVLTNAFAPLKNLQQLNLSRNALQAIHESHFNNCRLEQLDVSHNALAALGAGWLRALPALARLRLADNPRLGGAARLLLPAARRLQQLDAARAGLAAVPAALSPSVRSLALPGNRIVALRRGDLDSYPLLQALDLADNRLAALEDDCLGRLEMLVFLNLNRNHLTALPRSLPDELKYLSISSNRVRNVSRVDLKNLPNLRILLLQNNDIHYIEDHAFDDLLSLEMLDLSSNPIQSLSTSTFEGPLSLKDLRLCYLNVSLGTTTAGGDSDGAFPLSAPEGVQLLHLQGSAGLARLLLRDSAALAALSRLQYLDLRGCELAALRSDLLFYLVQLRTLRLHGNRLNCSAELWLRDWMPGGRAPPDNETCYYSTPEAKADAAKYNCTFPETFIVDERLPPVNLYSTEMINKLLRYYGYLGNKTEKAFKRVNSNQNNRNANSELKIAKDEVKKYIPDFYKTESYFQAKKENKILINSYFNETSDYRSRISSKLMDQNKIENDQQNLDRKFLDVEQYVNTAAASKTDELNSTIHKSGNRLNTPIEANKSVIPSVQRLESSKTTVEVEVNYTTTSTERREYLAYEGRGSRAAEAAGLATLAAVLALATSALALWMRTRRRTAPPDADQIEVANISGGVLW